jgi:hypothetical protein
VKRRLLGPVAILAILAIVAGCDPAGYGSFRVRGTVVSLRAQDGDTILCLTEVRDAGGTDVVLDTDDCLAGIPQGYKPKFGDCVVAETEHESAVLRITRCGDEEHLSPWKPTTSGGSTIPAP